MVEIRRVERPDVGVDTLMLLVAGFAIPADLAVDSLFGGDSFGDRLMAGQAVAGFDFFSVRMAFRAIRITLERAMRLGKRTGRDEFGLSLLAG
jgi:hypothetical protein